MNSTSANQSERRIRVLLISKYPIVQESLKLLIESGRDLIVCGMHAPLDDIGDLEGIERSDVGVVYLSEDDRLELVSDLLEKAPDLRIVVITDGLDLEAQAQLFKLGAFGIVRKEQGPDLLIEAIRRTHNGETWLNQALLTKILEKGKRNGKKRKKGFAVESGESLTFRELEIIGQIGEGLKNKEIGEKLRISEATVRHHLSSIYGKIGVEDRLNLVIYAYERGLITVNDDPAGSLNGNYSDRPT